MIGMWLSQYRPGIVLEERRVDYRAVLADLVSMRSAVDAAIEGIKLIVNEKRPTETGRQVEDTISEVVI